MGLFDGIDVASANDDPYSVPVDSYVCTITQAEAKATKAGDKVGLNLTYTISEGAYKGSPISDWKEIPPKPETDDSDVQAEYMRKRSFLKQRMLSFGVPESRINAIEASDLIGIDLVVTLVKSKSGKTVIKNIQPANGATGVSTTPGNPFLS
jgi:hypothetical protein